ncbi:hypothetical protein [Vreelandella lionensis]|uniref:hypothetical protein n=1 Tax=Vreelandella lionensis TaxID=1144478 RepID=UPI0009F5C834|nr:hypothetical protein [Halomonas lionensis]
MQKHLSQLAIAALLAAPYALAEYNGSNDFDTDAYLDVDVENDISVALEHSVANSIEVGVTFEMEAASADNFAAATIDRKQFTDDNAVYSDKSVNNAGVTGSSNNATGNIGINVASGDLNKQANDTSIASGNAGEESGVESMLFGGRHDGGNVAVMAVATAEVITVIMMP